jgi:UDP-N-acetyl-D-glucosamine/UDP-N-acetyl-D-galactosamine dehydrogenase
LQEYNIKVEAYDPWVNAQEVKQAYAFSMPAAIPHKEFDAIIIAVKHKQFLELDLSPYSHAQTVIYDVKGFLKNYTKRL